MLFILYKYVFFSFLKNCNVMMSWKNASIYNILFLFCFKEYIFNFKKKKKQKYLNDNKNGTFREKYLISMRPITEEIVFLVRII